MRAHRWLSWPSVRHAEVGAQWRGQHVPEWKQCRYLSRVAVLCDRIDVQAVLRDFVIGDRVNLEADAFAKMVAAHVDRMLAERGRS